MFNYFHNKSIPTDRLLFTPPPFWPLLPLLQFPLNPLKATSISQALRENDCPWLTVITPPQGRLTEDANVDIQLSLSQLIFHHSVSQVCFHFRAIRRISSWFSLNVQIKSSFVCLFVWICSCVKSLLWLTILHTKKTQKNKFGLRGKTDETIKIQELDLLSGIISLMKISMFLCDDHKMNFTVKYFLKRKLCLIKLSGQTASFDCLLVKLNDQSTNHTLFI